MSETIVSLFEDCARRAPEAVAVEDRHSCLSYRELNARANRLARALRARGIGDGDCVALTLERSFETLVATLGVLKSGAAYVPIDVTFPAERIAYMIADTGAKLTLTREVVGESVAPSVSEGPGGRAAHDGGLIAPPVPPDPSLTLGATDNLALDIPPSAVANVMYTSGTTGKPKGAEVPHSGVVRLLRDAGYIHLDERDVVLHHSTPSFDAATFEMWAALINGGKLVLYPPEKVDFDTLARVVREHGVTTLLLTTSVFHLVAEHKPEVLEPLRNVVIGGDVLQPKAVRRAIERYPHLHIVNGYGPTENCVFTTCFVITRDTEIRDPLPIGTPIRGTNVFLLDADRNPVPPGQPGELYTNGLGMARGYRNQPELTREKFVDGMYRTGDLVRLGEDGNYYFIGRADNQVKIRGFRIEPAEIEAAIHSRPDVADCVVLPVANGDGEKHLVAFYTSRNGGVAPAELRRDLAAKLPAHMVPAFFEPLAAFPLTPNGKIDRKKLVYDRHSCLSSQQVEQEDRQECLSYTERLVLDVWRQHLGAPALAAAESIYDHGASSLTVIVVHSELNDRLGCAADPVQLLQAQTPLEWAGVYQRSEGGTA